MVRSPEGKDFEFISVTEIRKDSGQELLHQNINCVVYGTRRFKAAFTSALNSSRPKPNKSNSWYWHFKIYSNIFFQSLLRRAIINLLQWNNYYLSIYLCCMHRQDALFRKVTSFNSTIHLLNYHKSESIDIWVWLQMMFTLHWFCEVRYIDFNC